MRTAPMKASDGTPRRDAEEWLWRKTRLPDLQALVLAHGGYGRNPA